MDVFDFFDREEIDRPFVNGTEDTAAYITWYDMFLAAAMDKKSDPEKVRRELLQGMDILNSRARKSSGKEISSYYGIGISRAAEEYSLYGFGFFCLIMAVAQEMDGHYRSAYTLLDDEESDDAVLTLALAENLYAQIADPEELLETRKLGNALRYCPLFTFYPPKNGRGSLYYSFEANRQFAAVIKGDYLLERSLALVCREEIAAGAAEKLPIHENEFEEMKSILSEGYQGDDDSVLIQITGAEGSGKTQLIINAFDEGTAILFLSFSRYNGLSADLANSVLDDVLVRCRLLNEILVITDINEKEKESLELLLSLCFTQLDLVILETKKNILLNVNKLSCTRYQITMPPSKTKERLELWKHELNGIKTDGKISAEELARKYRLQPGMIHNCVLNAQRASEAEGSGIVTQTHITEAVLSETTTRLDTLGDRIPLKFTWDDLVIDERQKEIMNILCNRIRYRGLVDEEWGFEKKIAYGKGVSMIIYGPPGTGKTMAAQVMAQDIGMALYRVDLSQLVDKYIGETEKNIGQIFDAASDGNVILFFDEADALFSKRTDVQSSNDKHANTQVAYLLQRIEQHDGVTFLATNRFADFDSAFVRRLTYAIHLERPDAEMRLKLYEKILPKETPRTKDLDLKFFADTFELSGSEIKEVLYSAAFIAVSEGKELGNTQLARAVKYQQEKTGKLVSNGTFGQYGAF